MMSFTKPSPRGRAYLAYVIFAVVIGGLCVGTSYGVAKAVVSDVAGATGPAGATGAAGVTGTAGVTGAAGVTGMSGTEGKTGSPGQAGLNGAAGSQGVAGRNGSDGLPGTVGPVGPVGPAGMAAAYEGNILTAADTTMGQPLTSTRLQTWLSPHEGANMVTMTFGFRLQDPLASSDTDIVIYCWRGNFGGQTFVLSAGQERVVGSWTFQSTQLIEVSCSIRSNTQQTVIAGNVPTVVIPLLSITDFDGTLPEVTATGQPNPQD